KNTPMSPIRDDISDSKPKLHNAPESQRDGISDSSPMKKNTPMSPIRDDISDSKPKLHNAPESHSGRHFR
ncbi:MAG: hypothetical protein LHW51_00545, partial [Candidatus Cloacimonetes bacterium]|nr:hypothetical protein [Candidatus Cloacimonadota bacterium]MCK9243461.1 hypothetical protein [Candidatus Cloacimonadota bacterium]